MLFDGTSKAMVDKIEQVVRLIRSKGVGVYFVTQSPSDIPENILGQLGNRVQHALRAFTPKDQKAVRAAADTFRANPAFKTADAIMELETGEALISILDEKGAPTVVERAKILFPLSQIGAITEEQRADIIKKSRIYGRYDKAIDRESAFEVLLKQSEEQAAVAQQEAQAAQEEAEAAKKEKEDAKKKKNSLGSKVLKAVSTALIGIFASSVGSLVGGAVSGKKSSKKKSSSNTAGKVAGRVATTATRTVTKELTRDILGNLIK